MSFINFSDIYHINSLMMRKGFICFLMVVTAWTLSAQKKIKVGVFEGRGAAETCVWEAQAAASMDKSIDARIVHSKDIASGVLSNLDVLVIPGGGGSNEYLNMGTENHKRIKKFVSDGGGVVGICAGAYLLSNTPKYSCLEMSGGRAIDIEHDNRGRGVAKVVLNAAGKKVFPEVASRDTLYIMYYEGPVIVPDQAAEETYRVLAMMESDVHVEGEAPANMTNDKPFFYITNYGRGKVFSSVGHPEATPGMQWMLPRMIRAVLPLNKQLKMQVNQSLINPNLFNKEILMTKDRREHESGLFKTFLYGTPQEKIDGIEWIGDHLSWDGKRWLQGLIFDSDRNVRLAAVKQIGRCMYRYYLPDLESQLKVEKDPQVRSELLKVISRLK